MLLACSFTAQILLLLFGMQSEGEISFPRSSYGEDPGFLLFSYHYYSLWFIFFIFITSRQITGTPAKVGDDSLVSFPTAIEGEDADWLVKKGN